MLMATLVYPCRGCGQGLLYLMLVFVMLLQLFLKVAVSNVRYSGLILFLVFGKQVIALLS